MASELEHQHVYQLRRSIQSIPMQVFSSRKTAKLQNDITSFFQAKGESLYEAWERFKELQRECPHHGILDRFLIQTFYNGLQQPTKISIDTAAKSVLMAKPINEAKQLLEDIASNNYHWENERGQPKRGKKT